MAEPICGAADWDAPARLLGSCLDLWRAAFNADLVVILRLLQPDAHAFRFGQGHTATTGCSTNWDHRHDANFIWIASSLRADMIFGNDRYATNETGQVCSGRLSNQEDCQAHIKQEQTDIDAYHQGAAHNY